MVPVRCGAPSCELDVIGKTLYWRLSQSAPMILREMHDSPVSLRACSFTVFASGSRPSPWHSQMLEPSLLVAG